MRLIRKIIPAPVREIVNRLHAKYFRKMLFGYMDLADRLTASPDDLAPPRKWAYNTGNVGGIRGIREGGIPEVEFIIETVGLARNEKVLDVGCGVGVKAIPLAKYMAGEGEYEGFDIVAEQIAWLQQNVTPRFPNFRFLHADIHNKWYNPSGKIGSSEYVFPYGDETFDFVFLISVFTHMLPAEVENYLSEISRVLKAGGRCFITYFLLDSESMPIARKGINGPEFKHEMNEYWVEDLEFPETAVAYREEYIRGLYDRFGMSIKSPLVHGSWRGRQGARYYQDAIVGWKREGVISR